MLRVYSAGVCSW